MIVFIVINFSLQFICSTTTAVLDTSNIRYNSLISAQCKARCLYEYRNHYQQRSPPTIFNNGKTKRLLTTNALTLPWRSIWKRCPRLITCSSCLLPCDLNPPLLLSNEQSCQAICSTLQNVECQRSCMFIQNLYQQQSNCLTDDCQSSSCSPINDCFEKIPEPRNVSAIERKSRRTVKLKWSPNEVTNTEPVFYVIEAQWTMPKAHAKQEDTISKWGFVKEEVSHTKAIIRNIQRDNRLYKFRVAAVTRLGYSSFSTTTKPFRLNSQHELQKSLIASPKDFAIKDVQLNLNTVNVTVTWQRSDIPVSGYQISWETQNDSPLLINTIDLPSSLHPLELTIPFLSTDIFYTFKIRSLFTSNDDDQLQTSLPLSIKFNYEDELFSIKNFAMSEPYFINGLIKTNVSWNKINNHRVQQYDLHWIETQCFSDALPCCYRRSANTKDSFFPLYDLRFNCTYVLNIKPIVSQLRTKKSFQVYFNVSSCQEIQVYGSIRPSCQTNESSSTSPLSSLDLIVSRNESGIQLYWQDIRPLARDDTGIVYQLHIEQLPTRSELISVHLSPTITSYFLPYSNMQTDRYLNVTLTVVDNSRVQQQKSIIIDGDQHHPILSNMISSSSSRQLSTNQFLFIFMLVSVGLIKR